MLQHKLQEVDNLFRQFASSQLRQLEKRRKAIMPTNAEIKKKGLKVLIENLGDVEAEKFIRLIRQEPFDYTTWQDALWENKSVRQVSEEAMKYRRKGDKEE